MEKDLVTYLGEFVFKSEIAYAKYLELLEEAKTNPLAYKELIEILYYGFSDWLAFQTVEEALNKLETSTEAK